MIARDVHQTFAVGKMKEVLIVKSVVINVRCHPCTTSIWPLSISLSLSSGFLPPPCSSPPSFSFSLHPTSALSVSFPLIIPYLYLGPFGSQWRYLACSDWVETPPNLITQSVGRGTKEVAMAVSLHTARIPFGLPLSVTSFTSRSSVISLPPILTSVRYLPSFLSFSLSLPLFLSLLLRPLSPTKGYWHWGIKPLAIRL